MIAQARKRCSACGDVKPLSAFYRKGNRHQAYCRDCVRTHKREYTRRVGKSVLRRAEKYGLTVAEVQKILLVPVCQACGDPLETSHSQKFDHCHARGDFRGVLCHACNIACSGHAEDAVPRLQACIDYLTRYLEWASEQG